MAKKKKRAQRKTMRAPVTQFTAPQAQVASVPPKAISTAKAPSLTKVDLAQEYHYVFADLRKIALIAAAMFALLFVLAFVLK
jgi:hypothetical protein